MRDFINNRLNKDNFWNVMFFAFMLIGMTVVFSIKQPFAGILFWIVVISVPMIVKIKSNITFDKKKMEFIVNKSNKFRASGAEFILLMIGDFAIISLIGLILDGTKASTNDASISFFVGALFLFIPVLYCIFRNLPIAIYFKKEAWVTDQNNSSYPSSSRSHKNWLWYNVWNKH